MLSLALAQFFCRNNGKAGDRHQSTQSTQGGNESTKMRHFQKCTGVGNTGATVSCCSYSVCSVTHRSSTIRSFRSPIFFYSLSFFTMMYSSTAHITSAARNNNNKRPRDTIDVNQAMSMSKRRPGVDSNHVPDIAVFLFVCNVRRMCLSYMSCVISLSIVLLHYTHHRSPPLIQWVNPGTLLPTQSTFLRYDPLGTRYSVLGTTTPCLSEYKDNGARSPQRTIKRRLPLLVDQV